MCWAAYRQCLSHLAGTSISTHAGAVTRSIHLFRRFRFRTKDALGTEHSLCHAACNPFALGRAIQQSSQALPLRFAKAAENCRGQASI